MNMLYQVNKPHIVNMLCNLRSLWATTRKKRRTLYGGIRRFLGFFRNTCEYCNEGKIVKGQKIDLFDSKIQIYKCTKCGMTGF